MHFVVVYERMRVNTDPVWINGKIVPSSEAVCRISGASFMNGAVILEDARCCKGAQGPFIFRLSDHVKQFMRSAKIASMDIPHSTNKLARAALSLAKACGMEEGIVRFVAYYDGDFAIDALFSEDAQASVAIFCSVPSSDSGGANEGSSAAAGAEGEPAMATAGISSWRAISGNALPSQAEVASVRANAAFAMAEARRRGFDEPLLLTEAGDVCSGARKALFAVRDGVLSTPPIACGVRESVERDTVINFAMDLDVPIVEERITRADLCIADELFLCDALRGVVPLSAVDGSVVGNSGKAGPKPGPITGAILKRYEKAIAGKLDEYAAWISPIGGEGA